MLPRVDTEDEWDAIVPDETVMRPGVAALCTRLGLRADPLTRYSAGSLPVYAVGNRYVLKLFPAASADEGVTEAHVLTHLQGQLPVPTPYVHDAGTYENGWRYVLMSRLRGTDLAVTWPRIPRADQDRIATEAGETLAALHALDPAPLAGILGPDNWDDFRTRQRTTAVDRQRAHGLPGPWLEQLPDFLAAAPLSAPGPDVLLHTEFMRQHLTVDAHDDWRLTGLLDFEPAMLGRPAYDFVAVGLYVSRADPRLLSRIFRAYGETFTPTDLLTHTLLHVHSNLPRYLRELPAPPEPTLESLAETWFGVG